MSTVFSGAAPASDVANALIDLQYELQGAYNGVSEANFLTNAVSRAERTPLGASASLWGIITGGVVSIVRDATTGIRVVQFTTGAGSRSVRLASGNFSINSGAQFGGTIPNYRRLRRYRSGALIAVPVRGATILEFGLGFANGMLTFLGATPAFVLSSDPGVNAGRWTARVRQIDAGGITTLNDTGLTPSANFDYYEVQYTEGPVPLLELLVNGVTVAIRTGLTEVPTTSTVGSSGSFGFGASAAAGTTLQYAAARYRVEEL